MSSSRGRRAWPVDKILYRYFQLREAGGPSPTMNLEGAPLCGCKGRQTPEVPKWIRRLCDVGFALEKIAPPLKVAVEGRWKAVLALEDAERDVMMLDIKMCNARRAGGDWRAIERKKKPAEDASHEAFRVKMRLSRRKAYREGMDALDDVIAVESVP